MPAPSRAWFVIGPSGGGKSTLGAALAARLGAPFVEGDAFHPPANIEKMRRGEPLTDADRQPWLTAVARAVRERARAEADVVVACSALKRSYRDLLRRESGADVRTIFLSPTLDAETRGRRVAARTGHFMPASLLASQIEAFEPPLSEPDAVILPPGLTPDALVEAALAAAVR